MAPARPYWKGYLKLSLVSCPVALYAATSSTERVAFRQINRTTGNRLRQQLIDDVTREPIEAGEKARGYEVAKNQYMLIEEEELDAVTIESNHTIEIDSFVPRSQIDERYFDSPYYLVPNEPVGQEAFAVIRDASFPTDPITFQASRLHPALPACARRKTARLARLAVIAPRSSTVSRPTKSTQSAQRRRSHAYGRPAASTISDSGAVLVARFGTSDPAECAWFVHCRFE